MRTWTLPNSPSSSALPQSKRIAPVPILLESPDVSGTPLPTSDTYSGRWREVQAKGLSVGRAEREVKVTSLTILTSGDRINCQPCCLFPWLLCTGPYRSFAHTIRDIEHMLQPSGGGDNHDESFASWYHQPRPIHRAQVVASRGGREEGMNCVDAGSADS